MKAKTTVSGFDRLEKRISGVIGGAPLANRKAVEEAALITKNIGIAEIAKDIGADLSMSNFGKGGVRVRPWYNVRGKYRPTAVIRPVPPGPAQLLETGSYRKPGGYGIQARIGNARTKRGRRERRQALYDSLFGGVNVGFLGSRERNFAAMGVVHHPGTEGKGPWARTTAKAKVVAGRALTRAGRREYARLLAGR